MSKSIRAKLRKITVLASYVSVVDGAAQAKLDEIARLSKSALADLDATEPAKKFTPPRYDAEYYEGMDKLDSM